MIQESIRNLMERYPEKDLKFSFLGISPTIEHSEASGSWGSALSLSIEETLQYSLAKRNSFIPSVGLLFSVAKRLHKKEGLIQEEEQLLKEFKDYWHRTASVLVFPTKDQSGYVLHYPRLRNERLARLNDDTIDGEIKIRISRKEFPPYGEIARIDEHPGFFGKILGLDYLDGYDEKFKEKIGLNVCLWIPPKKCILESPEKLIIFGAFAHYGMGLWLTSYTNDKALVGSRPFRLAYNLSEE